MAKYGTTDRCSGGTASADSVGDGLVAANAVDNNITTRWRANYGTFPHWWKYDFGAGTIWAISKVTVKCLNYTTNTCMTDFTIQGSNNDSDYSILYTGVHADNEDVQTFTFINRTKYRYIKINITTGVSAEKVGDIAEIEMFEGIYPSGAFLLFLSEAFKNHDRLWTPQKKLILPKDLGFSY